MQNSGFAALLAALCLIGAQAGTAGARTAPTRAPRLERMAYPAARTIILRNGWTPLAGDCEVRTAGTCGRLPEIGSCSAVAPGFCGMVFMRRSRCLYVVTTGGAPDGVGADARVKSVTFRNGPCGKS